MKPSPKTPACIRSSCPGAGARHFAALLHSTAAQSPPPRFLADAWRDALSGQLPGRDADAESDAARPRDAARHWPCSCATASSRYTMLSNEPAARIDFPAIPASRLPNQMPLRRSYATHALQATLPSTPAAHRVGGSPQPTGVAAASGFERTRSESRP